LTQDADGQVKARVGSVLNDKWTLERLLGAGGMGAVYAGLHRNGARAAVKVLHRFLSQHADVRARFLREGYAANRVDRPGVVKVLDDDIVVGGPDDGTAYLVMEMLEGQSLEERVAGGKTLTEREFLVIADSVLDVLDSAHTNGVVHRDIKPENIFIARDELGTERIKVLDFGLARLLEGHSTTTHGIALGTPSFMSPEQAAGRNADVDGRTDLFALAASGFRLITGRKIHEGTSPIDLMAKMASLPAPRIRTVAPGVSDAFARVIDRGLEFRRDDRYETAAAMRADVAAAIATLEAGSCSTVLPVLAGADKSMELSASDFEHTEPPRTVADPSSKPTAPLPREVDPASKPTVQLPRADEPASRPTVQLPRADDPSSKPTLQLPRAADLAFKPTVQLPGARAAEPEASSGQPATNADARGRPPEESAASGPDPGAPGFAEESLAPVPMQRGYLIPVVVALTILGLGGAAAYMNLDASTFGDGAPSESPDTARQPSSDAATSQGTDASLDAERNPPAIAEASVVANTPRPKVAPAHPASRPIDRGKQSKHPKR
jgi:serine/threonine protein kinase